MVEYEDGQRIVTCKTEDCENYEEPITVDDDGTPVVCGGGCDNVIAEAEPDKQDPPEDDTDDLADRIADMNEDQRAELIDLLSGGS